MGDFYALLIGINHYLPNKLPSGLYYKSLRGCVQDIARVEYFLRTRVNVPVENILKLTSSNGQHDRPTEPQAQWPTYANIVQSFHNLGGMAKAGDQVYIHYSGHGGRAVTTEHFRDLKGSDGIDEVLVPVDLGTSEGNYLRDTELHYLLTRLVEKGLLVTVVLDSCHAGGLTRGEQRLASEGGIRGLGEVDTTPRVTKTLVAPPEEVVRAWQASSALATRAARVGSGWLLEPQGYVLIAACRANEYANEVAFEANEVNGALSYWLVDSLSRIGANVTYKMLHDRVLAKVRNQFVNQTPQLQGEGDRLVFGGQEVSTQSAIPVISVNGNSVTLNAGRAHGLSAGNRLAVFPQLETDLTKAEKRIAVVEITYSEPAISTATIVEQLQARDIEPGCLTLPASGGSIRLSRLVRLVRSDPSAQSTNESEAIDRVSDLIQQRADGFIRVLSQNQAADYIVATTSDEYVISDRGGTILPNIKPLSINEPEAPRHLVDRLVHLAKYANVRELENEDCQCQLNKALRIELTGVQADFVPGEKPTPRPFNSHNHSVKDGEWTFLRIQNRHSDVVNITVLDLQPDWGISQIYPARGGAFETLDPGRELVLPLKVSLPPGYESGSDIIKVFGTIEPTSFRWLELPALDQPDNRAGLRGVPQNSLEKLLSILGGGSAHTRTLTVPNAAEAEWTVQQVEIEIVKSADRLGLIEAAPNKAPLEMSLLLS